MLPSHVSRACTRGWGRILRRFCSKPTQRLDYTPSPYSIRSCDLRIFLNASDTVVKSLVRYSREHPAIYGPSSAPLRLNAEQLELKAVAVDGVSLDNSQWTHSGHTLELRADALPTTQEFEVYTECGVDPVSNRALSGLYTSGTNTKGGPAMYITQCEAEGFRRISPYLDRPDVMARYRVYVEADAGSCPVLLSNGNMLEAGVCDSDPSRHWAIWEDPFKKPSYLFAVVAGKLESISDEYITESGRRVAIQIFSEPHNAMKWDEKCFGLEYDLDIFNVVATDDFNMGAMENKGLNVFNTSCLLADPKISTDDDYERVMGVVAHEYFHNWTGNRVTCQDWFQLTLKEGLTVYRDQMFSADMASPAAKRIEDVRLLRNAQFREDSGPMRHPIRPEEYMAIDNFYTATVYLKGAEVVRMYETILGKVGFRKGLDLYFQRHDGTAATCDDFRAAMADANQIDLTQFEEWYSQPGTPEVSITQEYDPEKGQLTLRLQQKNQAAPQGPPLHVPVAVGVLGMGSQKELCPTQVIHLKEPQQDFIFEQVWERPVVSALRGFSAPVKLRIDHSNDELRFLMQHDTDPFNCWEASQRLATRAILYEYNSEAYEDDWDAESQLQEAFAKTLQRSDVEASLQAYTLQLPSLAMLSEEFSQVDPDRLATARLSVQQKLAQGADSVLWEVYERVASCPFNEVDMSQEAIGNRRLANMCLAYIGATDSPKSAGLCLKQVETSRCMSDLLAATTVLASMSSAPDAREKALKLFYDRIDGDALALNKWFGLQAGADLPEQVSRVQELMKHPDFTLRNPNRAMSVLGNFAANMRHFHVANGQGYLLVADAVIELDAFNPQVAARMARSFATWERYEPHRQGLMRHELSRISQTNLSPDTREVISRCLGVDP